MKFLILQTFLAVSFCDESLSNTPDSQEQLNLFQSITGVNATVAQLIWREVEQGILTDLTSRSTQSNPKFRLELKSVSLIFKS